MSRFRMRHALVLAARAQTHGFRKGLLHARVSCLRPMRRRPLMILRPLAVFILARNPQTALRQRLLG